MSMPVFYVHFYLLGRVTAVYFVSLRAYVYVCVCMCMCMRVSLRAFVGMLACLCWSTRLLKRKALWAEG